MNFQAISWPTVIAAVVAMFAISLVLRAIR